MWFESKNSKGNVGVRGTRMWFSPKVMTRYVHVNYWAYEVEPCKYKGYEEDPDNDDFAFRFDDIEEFLQEWKDMEMEHDIFTKDVSPHIAEFDYCFLEILKELPKEGLFLIQGGGCDANVSVIHNYETIIKEMTEILEIAKKNNVTFFWV